MELAIPVVAFGWLYMISNQKKIKEKFTLRTPPQTSAERFYRPKVESSNERFTDMAGRNIDASDLSSQNGVGALKFTKSEVAPLFKPEDNINLSPFGSANQSDFYQSRVNPSMSMNSVKPFQQEMVGPGLNQGYGTQGSGGFNSGMEARDTWGEKTVDELRVVTNPKQTFTYDGHMGPAQTLVKNLGIEPKVEKHLPDRYFVNTPERYFTTTGSESAPTYRSKQMLPDVSRVHNSYVGGAGQAGLENMPQKPLIRQDNRQQFTTPLQLNPAGAGVSKSNVENERKSMTAYQNNRSAVSGERLGNIHALISAITAPVTDLVRPTRKDTLLESKRLGNASMTGPTPQLLPSAQKVATTTKETTTFSPYALGMRPYLPSSDGYTVTDVKLPTNNRDDTSISYTGNAGGLLPKPASYDSAYNATLSANRVSEGRMEAGSKNLFSGYINQTSHVMRDHSPNMGVAPSNYIPTPPTAQLTETRTPISYENLQRNTSDILDAFKANPYTHSLHSAA